jgi:hypothetical protein
MNDIPVKCLFYLIGQYFNLTMVYFILSNLDCRILIKIIIINECNIPVLCLIRIFYLIRFTLYTNFTMVFLYNLDCRLDTILQDTPVKVV